MITTIQNPRNFYDGRQVRVIAIHDLAGNLWCDVEMTSCSGLKTTVRREHLAAWSKSPLDARP